MSRHKTGKSSAEALRLEHDAARAANWKRWGPYLSERQWGTVREDYSPSGEAWEYFSHDHARSRAYRWGEDGLLGICDRQCRLCFAWALWNGRDAILKERLFGLTNREGNHGEDVKEEYYYLDSTPTHSYMKALYRYPRAAFPYERLLRENRARDRRQPEFELHHTGIFDEGFFDFQVEYAKADTDDILIRATITNHGATPATLHVLPTLWFRNTWSWGCRYEGCWVRPALHRRGDLLIQTRHATLDPMVLQLCPDALGRAPLLLFTDNETNTQRLYGVGNRTPFVKDGVHQAVIHADMSAIHPAGPGTKVAAWYQVTLAPGEQATLRLRLTAQADAPSTEPAALGKAFDDVISARIADADAFYAERIPQTLSEDEQRVSRQAYAGLLWSKQFYEYVVHDWLAGDPAQPAPPAERQQGRNADWRHLFNRDVLSVPDKWEYPWYAAWDLAFHMIPMARIDPDFAKQQLHLLLREWYMHPNGQLPAYEYGFDDVNPPVHAWAVWRVYKMTGPKGKRDRVFLERCFQKLLLNFTWWVNRKDPGGRHLFSGGFLGLDNIGVFDRSRPLPTGGHLEQADGTAWMAFYCTTMLAIAIELAADSPAYEDIASKFFEHFIAIADAMNTLGGSGLWDEDDGFYYDQLRLHGMSVRLRVRSMVGLIPLFAVLVLEADTLARMPGFRKRLEWFLENRRDLHHLISCMETLPTPGGAQHYLLAIPSRERLARVLRYVLDEREFLSDHGIRSLSAIHRERPYVFRDQNTEYRVAYVPGESDNYLFGGNSNWRGPVWLPVNYLLTEALQRYHFYYGDTLQLEYPTGSGQQLTLDKIAQQIHNRLTALFLRGEDGRRPCMGDDLRYRDDPRWRDLLLFHEYFHGDTGCGLGASHQTGWTALVARLLDRQGAPRVAQPGKTVRAKRTAKAP